MSEDRIPVRWLRDRLGLLSEEDVAALFDIKENTLAVWRSENYGPRPTKLGRKVFYLESEVREWVNKQMFAAPESGPA